MSSSFLAVAVVLCISLHAADAIEIKVLFFPEKDLNGASMTYQVNVDGTCTDCQNFGDARTGIWESYVLAAPVSSGGNYSLALFDSHYCNGRNEILGDSYGDIPDSLGDQVATFRVCPPGQTP